MDRFSSALLVCLCKCRTMIPVQSASIKWTIQSHAWPSRSAIICFMLSVSKYSFLFNLTLLQTYLAQSQPRCPYCQVFFSAPRGNQSSGSMTHRIVPGRIPGFNAPDHIEITYTMDSGIQGANHLRPGVPFHGTQRVAYLPNTAEGNKVYRFAFCCIGRFCVSSC